MLVDREENYDHSPGSRSSSKLYRAEGIAISFYLNTDGTERNKGIWNIETKDLIKKARKELEGLDVSRRYFEAADNTLRRIQNFISAENFAPRYKSIAVFANAVEISTRYTTFR